MLKSSKEVQKTEQEEAQDFDARLAQLQAAEDDEEDVHPYIHMLNDGEQKVEHAHAQAHLDEFYMNNTHPLTHLQGRSL